jgi:hypothetical protein
MSDENVDYTVIDDATGAVVRSGRCPASMVYLQANVTQTVKPGVRMCDLTYEFKGGKFVRKPEKAPQPPKPQMPSLQEKVDALLEGGAKLEEVLERVARAREARVDGGGKSKV